VIKDKTRVILDTEVLKRDPSRRKGPFRALTRLSEKGNIKIHISDIAVREFLTDQQIKIRSAIDKSKNSLSELLKYPIPQNVRESIKNSATYLAQAESETFQEIKKSFDQWCGKNNVSIESIKDDHAQDVFDAYFTGKAPFKRIKNREDIPDAFIWTSVCDLCQNNTKVFLISGDKNLLNNCSKGPKNLTGYDSIESFLKESGLISILRDSILETQFEKIYESILREKFIKKDIEDIIEEELTGRKFGVNYPVTGVYHVQSLVEIKRIFFEDHGTYYGDGLIALPFSARALCMLSHTVQKPEIGDTENTESVTITPLKEGFVEIKLSRTIVFVGSILFAFDKSLFEEEKSYSNVIEGLHAAEVVLEYLSIYGEADSKVTLDIFNEHADDEAKKQVNEGNLDTELDADEESQRILMSRWFELPKELTGKYDKLEIKEGARVKIAPPPRFEEWVKVLKKSLLDTEDRKNDLSEEDTL
jgi:hypothetical protein